jgi:hypothetical protein
MNPSQEETFARCIGRFIKNDMPIDWAHVFACMKANGIPERKTQFMMDQYNLGNWR